VSDAVATASLPHAANIVINENANSRPMRIDATLDGPALRDNPRRQAMRIRAEHA
jgi:hypothetical protein